MLLRPFWSIQLKIGCLILLTSFHRKFNHLNNPLHSTKGSVSFNMSLHTKSRMTPSSHSNMPSAYKIKEKLLSSHSNMPSAYKIKKSYFAPTHFFANVGFFNYFGQLQNPLITLSKWRFQLRYACFSPWMDNWSSHTCLASSGSPTLS